MRRVSQTLIVLGAFLLNSSFFAEEQKEWSPLQHPAKLSRTITTFTEPSAFIDLKAEYGGRLLKWHVLEGSSVVSADKSGKAILVQQDDKLAKLALKKEQASLSSQRQLLKTKKAKESLLKREVAFRLLEMKRIEKLAKEGKVPRANFDKAVFEYDRSNLSLEQSAEEVALQKQAIVEQQVSVAHAEELLSRYKLYGNESWVLNERILEEGAWAKAGQVVARLANTKILSIYLRLNDKEFKAFRSDALDGVTLKTSLTDSTVKAKLHRIDRRFDPVSRKRLVELRVEGSTEESLLSGTELKYTVLMPYPQAVVEVPKNFTYKKYERVYVKTKTGEDLLVNPLRHLNGKLYINAAEFPAGTVLVKP
mgnify:CR=1 FL=1